MQSGTNPTLDASAAHSPEIREDDPRHLGNLTTRMNSLNAQVSVDTKYDPTPPPRVGKDGKPVTESFVANVPVSDLRLRGEYFYAFGGLSLIILVAIFIVILDPTLRIKIFKNTGSTIFISATVGVCLATMISCYLYYRQIQMDIWYPRYN